MNAVSKSRSKPHQAWGAPFSRALYIIITLCPLLGRGEHDGHGMGHNRRRAGGATRARVPRIPMQQAEMSSGGRDGRSHDRTTKRRMSNFVVHKKPPKAFRRRRPQVSLPLSVSLFPGAFSSYFSFPRCNDTSSPSSRPWTASQPSKGSIEAEEARELAGRERRTEKLPLYPCDRVHPTLQRF